MAEVGLNGFSVAALLSFLPIYSAYKIINVIISFLVTVLIESVFLALKTKHLDSNSTVRN